MYYLEAIAHNPRGERVVHILAVLILVAMIAPKALAEDESGSSPAVDVASIPEMPSPSFRMYNPFRMFFRGVEVRITWAGPPDKPIVALTFDDGPHPVFTPQILRILEDHGVPATFFVVGRNGEKNPELLRLAKEKGHALGNHTFSHTRITAVTNGRLKEEIERTREIIFLETGVYTQLFRPPFGAFDARSLAEVAHRDLEVVLWSVDSRDWATHSIGDIRRNVEKRVHPGAIILMHDVHQQTVEALPGLLEFLKGKGYTFVTIPELLPIDRVAWGG
jgi:peptidoglycan/xylan/chitin deacetylase (PgdA/CDA1 family)